MVIAQPSPNSPAQTFLDSAPGAAYMNGFSYQYNATASQATFSIETLYWTATIYAVEDCTFEYPSGEQSGLEFGLLNMEPVLGLAPLCTNNSCSLLGHLSATAAIESSSYGLHIGSASLNYSGSLILGGYDSGRAIGPLLSTSGLTLLDVMIGVEAGRSPFPFSSQSGLLITTTGSTAAQPIPVSLEPTFPYIFLPQQTIDSITRQLPVFFEATSRYYLWNTSDSSYSEIVKSASYLGFVFQDPTVIGANVTIKVPFMLLNLQLEASVSGLEYAASYFPLQPMQPLPNIDYTYILGRAFLQAAFVGFNTNASWVAQAPGPGQERKGLGYEPKDLTSSTSAFNVQFGDDLFNQSWSGVWTPLPSQVSGTNFNPNSASSSPFAANSKSNTGLIIGVVIGGAAFLGIPVGTAIIFLRRKKRRLWERAINPFNAQPFNHEDEKVNTPDVVRNELYGSGMDHELPPDMRLEMPERGDPAELPLNEDAQELTTHDTVDDAAKSETADNERITNPVSQ